MSWTFDHHKSGGRAAVCAALEARLGSHLIGEEEWSKEFEYHASRRYLTHRRCSSPNPRRSSSVCTMTLAMSSSPVDPLNVIWSLIWQRRSGKFEIGRAHV